MSASCKFPVMLPKGERNLDDNVTNWKEISEKYSYKEISKKYSYLSFAEGTGPKLIPTIVMSIIIIITTILMSTVMIILKYL